MSRWQFWSKLFSDRNSSSSRPARERSRLVPHRRTRVLFAEPLESRLCLSAYHVAVLGSTGNGPVTPTGINSSGQIAGYGTVAGQTHGFLYSNGALTDLASLGGGYSYAFGLNDAGQVVGESRLSSGPTHAFLYSGGSMHDLGTLDGAGVNSAATAINNAGQIAGYSQTSGGSPNFGFLYSGGSMTGIGSFGGYSNAYGMNEAPQIVGHSNGQAFLWSGGAMHPISNALAANAINESGQVTGQSFGGPGNAQSHAFLYASGTTTNLGTLGGAFSVGRGINDSGQIVGYSDMASGPGHAFLYSGGVMRDLNTLAEPGFVISDAFGINNAGQIAAYGIDTTTGQAHGLLLTPSLPDVFDAVDDFSNSVNTNSSLWSYRYRNDEARDGSYSLLPVNSSNFPWSPTSVDWNNGGPQPAIGVNRSGAGISGPGFIWPDNTVWMTPAGLAVVSWQSPFSGMVDIHFSFSEIQPNGPGPWDGVSWFVDRNDASGQLAGGVLGDLQSTGVLQVSAVSVNAGDRINFVVDRNLYNAFDSVALTATIQRFTAPSITSVAASNAPYDGSPHGATAIVTGVGGLNQSLSVTYSGDGSTVYGPTTDAPVDAGSYIASASYPGDGSYLPSSDSEAFTIAKAGSSTLVTASDAVFDGNPQGGAASVTGPGGLNLSLAVTYVGINGTSYGPTTSAPINAGAYIASASYAGDANHLGSSDERPFTIAKADATIAVSGYSGVYDGSPHGATGSAAGVDGDPLSGLNLGATFTNVPGGTANWAFTDVTGNYNDASGSAVVAISKAPVNVAVVGGTYAYDGLTHEAASSSVTGAGGLNAAATLAYYLGTTLLPGAPTSAGNYTVVASYAGDGNHDPGSASAPLVILLKDLDATGSTENAINISKAGTLTFVLSNVSGIVAGDGTAFDLFNGATFQLSVNGNLYSVTSTAAVLSDGSVQIRWRMTQELYDDLYAALGGATPSNKTLVDFFVSGTSNDGNYMLTSDVFARIFQQGKVIFN